MATSSKSRTLKKVREAKVPKKAKAAPKTKTIAKTNVTVKKKRKQRLATKHTQQHGIFIPVRLAVAGLAGILLIFVGVFYYFYAETVLSFKASPVVVAQAELRGATPTHITIPNLKVGLDITPTFIQDGIWQVSDTTAAYLESSARPEEGGNIIIYGHNKRELFGPLRLIKLGDTINLTADDGKQYAYKVAEVRTVSPDAINEVMPTDYEVLTVYTCTGIFDSQRLVIKAYPTQLASL